MTQQTRVLQFAAALMLLLISGMFSKAEAQPFNPVTVSAELSVERLVPGSHAAIAVVLDHEDGFHVWTHEPVLPEELGDFTAIPTNIEFQLPQGLRAGDIQWPNEYQASVRYTGSPVFIPVYEGRAVAYIPIIVDPEAAAVEGAISINVSYQSCNDITCYAPTTDVVEIAYAIDSQAAVGAFDAELFADYDEQSGAASLVHAESASEAAPEESQVADSGSQTPSSTGPGQTFFGIPIPSGGVAGLVMLGLLGAAGGLILNLTPCVLPVIPIKVMTLSQHAGESRVRAALLGFWMALGVVAFWAALAIPVLTLQNFTDPSRIFGIWWLTTSIGVLIALMSFGLMGMFAITLPQKTYMFNPKADSASGSFMFGVMTAILGLPCFGFVAGALVPAAITQGTAFVITLFASMGVGMALPYLVLSIFPQLLSKLPKTGPASDLVKQVMGLLLLAAAAYFIGSGLIALVASKPYLAKLIHIWVAAFFGIGAGLWLMIKTIMITKKPVNRVVFSGIALSVAGIGLLVATSFTSDAREAYELRKAAMADAAASGTIVTTTWNDYSPQLMERVIQEGHVVIQDFTAEWCINCKVLEKTVLGAEPVKSLLQADDTVMVKVDLTGSHPEGWAALEELGRTGIPTLAIYGHGLEEPWVANAYTIDQVAAAIERARGGG